ncbi:hypothetical protein H8356DRAFT_1438291 [Neocallimastix lanati (nom. inval.)]|nr:hypothetical protein H8356DRAFT_1438291 [Neocallimastix sp. JGI-2020a]
MKKSNDNINNNYNNNREDNYNIVKNNKKVYMKPPERHPDYNKKKSKGTHNRKLREHISKKLCLPQSRQLKDFTTLPYDFQLRKLSLLDGLTECSSNLRYVIQNIIENFLSVSPVPNFPFKSSLLGIPFVDIFNNSNCAPPLRARDEVRNTLKRMNVNIQRYGSPLSRKV